MNSDQEYAELLKRAHDLGIISIGGTIINKDILQDAIESTEKIYASPEYQQIVPELEPKLSHCTIQADPTLLRDIVEVLEQHPLDFHAIAAQMDAARQSPEK